MHRNVTVFLAMIELLTIAACGDGNPPNAAPRAVAGDNVTVATGSPVTLDGLSSSDPDGSALEYLWSFVSRPPGSAAVLDDNTSAAPSFTPDRDGEYVLSLVVTDGAGAASDPSLVRVTSVNTLPLALAGGNRSVLEGTRVTLSGGKSSDANGDPLTYLWSLDSAPPGSGAAFDNSASPTPSFTADLRGDYAIRLVVSDGKGNSTPDNVTVTAARCPAGTTWEDNVCSTARTVAYFPLNGTLVDNAAAYSGTLGSGGWVSGIDNQSPGALSGPRVCSNSYAARVDSFPEMDNSFTVEAFINPSCSGSDQGNLTVAKWANGYGGPGFILFSEPSPYGAPDYIFYLRLTSATASVSAAPPAGVTFPCGSWYHVAGVREGGTAVRIFVDGVEQGSVADTVGSIANGKPLTFSGHPDGGCGWGMSPVTIDDVAIYSKALSPLEIRGHSVQYR